MEFSHKTVLLDETLRCLDIDPDGIYVDGTAGGAGLSFELASRLSCNGQLISIDQDPDAVLVCHKRLSQFSNVNIVKDNFSNIKSIVHKCGLKSIDGIVLDLGVSSHQLDSSERGFSYKKDALLDMRMSQEGQSAYDVVNCLGYDDLRMIIHKYGEERFASRIAAKIVEKRVKKNIETTTELADIVRDAIPCFARREGGHPARKTFQALRIYVNRELDSLSKCLDDSFDILNKGGKIVVITFHSLEDRMVKDKMRFWATGCTCPSDFPICVCKNSAKARVMYKKAIVPSDEEVVSNFRSRSAKLRVCEKIV